MKNKINDSDDDNEMYVPDFGHRYMTEDIPYGLVITKAIVCLMNQDGYKIDTPIIDKILLWAQTAMNKKYIKKDENGNFVMDMESSDVKKTRIPQVYGIDILDKLINM